ncbi:hypothetical protein PS15m_000040 [Mucor circinelloides]
MLTMDTKSKQPYGIFPSDIWELVAYKLSLKDTYTLARTNKSMWELIRHIPISKQLEIKTNELVIPSFLLANTRHVHALINKKINYASLSQLLKTFYELETVDFSQNELAADENDIVTSKVCRRLLLCLPSTRRSKNLCVLVSKRHRAMFEEASSNQGMRRISLRSVLKRTKKEEDEDERSTRRMRTPSPIRDDLEEMKDKIATIKETFSDFAANPAYVVPSVLKSVCQGQLYSDIDSILTEVEEPQTKQEADRFVGDICSRLVESIVVSSKGTWIYVTQAEAYMRDAKNIDDCANTTITIQRPSKAKFAVEQKREYQNQWLEAKLYFKNFEFLITGCLCGDFETKEVSAFLGASLGKDNMDDYWRVYVSLVPAPVVRECRLLRNFTKRASGFQWLLKSKRFHENGFSTSSALSLHALAEIGSIVAIGSLLLSWKALDQQNKQQLKAMLNNVEELKGLDLDATAVCVERVREMQIARGKKLALEIALLVMNEESVKDADYVELYKCLISSKLVTLNKRAIREKKYLLH